MKILKDNSIYVQMKDIAFLIDHDMLDLSHLDDIDLDGYSDDDFVRLTNKDIIRYIDALHFIVDYYQVKDDTVKDINDFISCIEVDKERIVKDCRGKEESNQFDYIYASLEHKIINLKDILNIIKGESSILLPDGVEEPNTPKDNLPKRLINVLLNKSQI